MALVDFLGVFGIMYAAFYQKIGLVENCRPIFFYHDWVKSLSHIFFGELVAPSDVGLYPGLVCIQHLMLRLVLCGSRSIPWNYASFLDYAHERVFLQKVGGGYKFIHNSLRDHFAQIREI